MGTQIDVDVAIADVQQKIDVLEKKRHAADNVLARTSLSYAFDLSQIAPDLLGRLSDLGTAIIPFAPEQERVIRDEMVDSLREVKQDLEELYAARDTLRIFKGAAEASATESERTLQEVIDEMQSGVQNAAE